MVSRKFLPPQAVSTPSPAPAGRARRASWCQARGADRAKSIPRSVYPLFRRWHQCAHGCARLRNTCAQWPVVYQDITPGPVSLKPGADVCIGSFLAQCFGVRGVSFPSRFGVVLPGRHYAKFTGPRHQQDMCPSGPCKSIVLLLLGPPSQPSGPCHRHPATAGREATP
ncbi:hypothetical protein NDU88_006849 [Pleurodeles waltl]|uniref:Uncharacterized protein n=1 Tax=Pleurodeles waltl TaxID=8319 RepID=A0AAV7UPD1_PLEWA|nr:hypothetical protein NDU88_006849 [Pleurodeles waltl]